MAEQSSEVAEAGRRIICAGMSKRSTAGRHGQSSAGSRPGIRPEQRELGDGLAFLRRHFACAAPTWPRRWARDASPPISTAARNAGKGAQRSKRTVSVDLRRAGRVKLKVLRARQKAEPPRKSSQRCASWCRKTSPTSPGIPRAQLVREAPGEGRKHHVSWKRPQFTGAAWGSAVRSVGQGALRQLDCCDCPWPNGGNQPAWRGTG